MLAVDITHITKQDKNGYAPLRYVVLNGYEKVVEMLLKVDTMHIAMQDH